MVDIPASEPLIIFAGSTIQWTKSLSDFPSSEYTLKYYLNGPVSIVLSASQYNSTEDHLISIAAPDSSGYRFGIYSWQSFAEKGSGATLEKYPIDSGFITIKTSVGKSHAKIMLEKIEAELEAMDLRIKSKAIANNEIIYREIEKLKDLRAQYRQEYKNELINERITAGKDANSLIRFSFRRST